VFFRADVERRRAGMTDIFISYARSTAREAATVADALRRMGYVVWRDDELPPHRAYTDVIEERLTAARAVVVLWSKEAVQSDWVRAEADLARRQEKLVQVVLDATTPPLPFNQIQCADLAGWEGDLHESAWRKVADAVAHLVGRQGLAVGDRTARAGHPPPPADVTAIAVLPFLNMSADPEQEYFSDGLSEELITQLSQIKRLRLVGRTSSFAFKGRSTDLRTIGEQLDATYVLEGSVRKAGQRLRITAQLVNCSDGYQVWSERYDRELTDIFQIQDDIARAVAVALSVRLGVGELDRPLGATNNIEAYDLMLRARALIRRRERGDADRAVKLLEQALELDPNFATAWYFLGNALTSVLTWSPPNARAVWSRIGEALDQCGRCAPDMWTAHEARANRLEMMHDWVGAEQANEESRRLAPTSAREPVLSRAHQLMIVGRLTEAVDFARQSIRIDPLGGGNTLHSLLSMLGRHDEAAKEYRRCVDLPGSPFLLHQDSMYFAMARRDAACVREQLSLCVAMGQNPFLIEAAAVFDDREELAVLIRAKVAALLAHGSEGAFTTHIALFAAWLDEPDLALAAWMTTARRILGVGLLQVWHPLYAAMRQRPGFKDLVREARVLDYWRATGQWGEFARPLGEDDFEIVR
jgi:adenylate cyclase